jgi:hypothetical protein
MIPFRADQPTVLGSPVWHLEIKDVRNWPLADFHDSEFLKISVDSSPFCFKANGGPPYSRLLSRSIRPARSIFLNTSMDFLHSGWLPPAGSPVLCQHHVLKG